MPLRRQNQPPPRQPRLRPVPLPPVAGSAPASASPPPVSPTLPTNLSGSQVPVLDRQLEATTPQQLDAASPQVLAALAQFKKDPEVAFVLAELKKSLRRAQGALSPEELQKLQDDLQSTLEKNPAILAALREYHVS